MTLIYVFLIRSLIYIVSPVSLNKREQNRIKLVSFEDESTPTEKIETKPLKFERKPILTNFPSVLLLNKSQNFKIINGVDIFNDWKE